MLFIVVEILLFTLQCITILLAILSGLAALAIGSIEMVNLAIGWIFASWITSMVRMNFQTFREDEENNET